MDSLELAAAAGVNSSLLRFVISTRTLRRDQARQLGALTIIAHDLRGPLTNLAVLIESMDAAARRGDEAELQGRKRRALGLIEHLDNQLCSMLSRACVRGDPLKWNAVRIDLDEVVNAALDLNRPIAERRSIALRCSGCDPIAVLGDRHLLVEAVDNLINNAIKHSEASSMIECEFITRDDRAVVRVKDQGCGLTEAQLRRLFHPFALRCRRGAVQRHPRRDSRSGSGLGLWITRLIAERHGGHIEVTSGGGEPWCSLRAALTAGEATTLSASLRRRCRTESSEQSPPYAIWFPDRTLTTLRQCRRLPHATEVYPSTRPVTPAVPPGMYAEASLRARRRSQAQVD